MRYLLLLVLIVSLGRSCPVMAGQLRLPLGAMNGGRVIEERVLSVTELRAQDMVLQRLDYSCGSAALATLFCSYLKQPYTEAEIIDFIVKTGNMEKIIVRKGFSLLDLKRFAEFHGVNAEGYALDYESLCALNCPVLVPLYRQDKDIRHFVIFRGGTEDRVFLADPALGRRTMFRSEFEEIWSPRVGMVFSYPDSPPAAHTPLSIDSRDAMYLTSENLRAVALAAAIQYIHQANEF